MMDRGTSYWIGVHHMLDRGTSYDGWGTLYDGWGPSYDGYLFSTNLLYLWFLIAQELKNLNSTGAVKLFFQYLIPLPSYSCFSHLDDLGSII